jgi:trehalose utilization protein
MYHHPDVQRVIANGIRWARPRGAPANTPRHVPVEEARETLKVRGGTVHVANGRLASQ